MNKVLQIIRSHPARFFFILFCLLIIPALVLFPMAESGSQAGMGFCLTLIILANAIVLIV